ncbi:class I SAM-dependent methyltransferase [bacterium]|nr:class I SAM-dependent methyltransferase [bacterium]
MGKRNPWDEVAQVYEENRPSYPEQLIDDLIDKAQLTTDDRLLEIGAGTGKATTLLAKRGFQIHCIEPGMNLAGILTQKCSCYPKVSIDIASFEEWIPAGDMKFDLIFSAQAFNWLEPDIRYRKCRQLLKNGGYLALFWYGHDNEPWESDIAYSGMFQHPQVFKYHMESTLDCESYIKTMESTSTYALMGKEAKSEMREQALNDIRQQGGFVNTSLNYQLYLAKAI